MNNILIEQNSGKTELPGGLRYERKFFVTGLNHNEIRTIINQHPAMFHQVFYKRNINNIYFDTADFSSYIDNVEGVTNRQKVRIRWYGDLFGIIKNPELEVKYKKGFLGWKERHKLPDFSLNSYGRFEFKSIFEALLKAKSFDLYKLNLNALTPSLLNRYERTYFLSNDKKFRITIDNKLEFYSINPIRDFFKTYIDEERTIIELKYDQHFDVEAQKITAHFPFRLTKSSKYVIGVDRVKNWKR
jgi:SPX domain protein involved in polyphosphate accumulation